MSTFITSKEGGMHAVAQEYILKHCEVPSVFYNAVKTTLPVNATTVNALLNESTDHVTVPHECYAIEMRYLISALGITSYNNMLPDILNLKSPYCSPLMTVSTYYIVVGGNVNYAEFLTAAEGLSETDFNVIVNGFQHTSRSMKQWEEEMQLQSLSQSISSLSISYKPTRRSSLDNFVILIDASDILHYVDIASLLNSSEKILNMLTFTETGDIVVRTRIPTAVMNIIIDMILLVYRGITFYAERETQAEMMILFMKDALQELGISALRNYQVNSFVNAWLKN